MINRRNHNFGPSEFLFSFISLGCFDRPFVARRSAAASVGTATVRPRPSPAKRKKESEKQQQMQAGLETVGRNQRIARPNSIGLVFFLSQTAGELFERSSASNDKWDLFQEPGKRKEVETRNFEQKQGKSITETKFDTFNINTTTKNPTVRYNQLIETYFTEI